MGLTEDRKKLEERSIRMIKRLEVPAAKINKIKTLAASGAYSSSADWNKALIQINAAYNDMNIIFSEYVRLPPNSARLVPCNIFNPVRVELLRLHHQRLQMLEFRV